MKAMARIGGVFSLAVAVHALALPVPVLARDSAPRADLVWSGGWGNVELLIRDDRAELVSHELGGTTRRLRMIATPDDALAVLADERLAFAWPALLNWAGDDLHILRENMVARARRAAQGEIHALPPASRTQQYIGDSNRAALQYSKALDDAGYPDQALAFVRERLAAVPPGSTGNYMRSALNTRLADLLFQTLSAEEAIALLQKSSMDKEHSSPFQINERITLAGILAQSGHYEEALKTVDEAWAVFSGTSPGLFPRFEKLPDSMAYFVAIRACALNGLGRREEALTLFARIPDRPGLTSEWSVTSRARYLALTCMGDTDRLAEEMARQIVAALPAGDILIKAQGLIAFEPERKVRDAAMTRDVVIKAMAGRMRRLDGPLLPALRGWRVPAKTDMVSNP